MKRTMWHVIKWVGIIAAVATMMLSAVTDNPYVQSAVIGAWLLFCLPFAAVFTVQCAFYLYHWLRHGDPFYDAAVYTRRNEMTQSFTQKKRKPNKVCPICGIPTRCRVQRSNAGYWVHVARG